MASLKQYDLVRIVSLATNTPFTPDRFNRRPPQVGDIAIIVEIYNDPEGYELECLNSDGLTEWLCSFDPQVIKLELINS